MRTGRRRSAPLFLRAAAVALVSATPASAHVTLERDAAAVGTYYKAVFRIPHGCKGAATVKLRVEVPAGVVSVKPQPKPGWRIEITNGKYPVPVSYHGTVFNEGVVAVTWVGGSLPDAYYDEFVFMAFLSRALTAGTTLYFPATQICETGETLWGEKKPASAAEHPAPALRLLPEAPGRQ